MVDDSEIHAAVRDRLADDDIDDTVVDHLEWCELCRNWQSCLRSIQEAAAAGRPAVSSAESPEVTQIVTAVRRSARARQTRRLAVGSAAAACVIGVLGAVVTVSDDPATNRLATLADAYDEQGTRFVFEASAMVSLPDVASSGELQPVSLREFPTCDSEVPPATRLPSLGDLTLLVESALAQEPCVALAELGELGERSEQTAALMATQNREAAARVEQLSTLEASDDPLVRASATAAKADANRELARTGDDLQRLLDAHDATVTELQPFAATDGAIGSGGFGDAATTSIRALATVVDQADDSSLARDSIEWTTVATGTWTVAGVDVAGSASTDSGSTVDFSGATDDPLQLAAVLFDEPSTLQNLLRSAPPTDGDTVRWEVPVDVASIAGALPLNATAVFVSGRLDRLDLRAVRSDGSILVLSFIPAR